MKGSLSAVIFCTVFEITFCFSINVFNQNLNDIVEDNLQIACVTTRQCEENGFKGFTCVDNECTCEESKMCEKLSVKTLVTKIGRSCVESSQCNMEKSFCNAEGKCECIERTISSDNKRSCLNVSETFGSPCEENVQCLMLNGACRNTKCGCPENMHADKGKCYTNVALDFPCKNDEECSNTNFSSCTSNKCACKGKYVKSETLSKCLLRARTVLSPCSEDIQCSSTLGFGSICSNRFCKCMELYHYKTGINKCVQDFLLGDLCGEHSDCHQPGGEESRLECILGICKCQPVYFEFDGYCLQKPTVNAIERWNTAQSTSDGVNGWTLFSLRDVLPYIISYLFFYLLI